MGPPPKYLIQRKLLRSVVKKVLPTKPLLPPQYSLNLFQCWKIHGIGSDKCLDEELQFDFVENETKLFKQKLNKFNIKKIINSQLTKPDYKQSGRHVKSRKYHLDQINFNNALF